MSEPPHLQTVHLSRGSQGVVLVDDITISVQGGEVLAIVGPSGSGKTSFLRLINRLDEPDRGQVLLHGQDYRQIPPRELRARVGMVMQRSYLFPGTVESNIRFGPLQRGRRLADEAVGALLEEVGLGGYAARDVSALSGGEDQRVSLARTLANEPEMLLMDEPTSALDEASKGEVEALIRRIIEEKGLTCLLVTHELAQARRLASRIMVMERGRLVRVESTI